MLDAKEEREAKRLREIACRLHIPMPEAFWTLEVFDKDGKLLQKHKQRSHSWTRNAYNTLFCQMASLNARDLTFGAGKLSIKDTGGVIEGDPAKSCGIGGAIEDIEAIGGGYGWYAPAASVAKGIVLGTGTNAESFEDYVIQTLIPEGAGAGQMNYAAQEAPSVSYASLVFTNEVVRYINNNSGGAIGVNEVALYVSGFVDGGGDEWCQVRDKLGATVTVPDTGQCKVTYTVELTYPS